jgi:type IV pilus assembly protein PilB
MNMGVPSYNITSAVNLIMAQRLLRRLHKCKVRHDLPPEALLKAGFEENILEELEIFQPGSCADCHEGYRGRTGIFEVMPLSEKIARIVLQEGDAMKIAQQARAEGIDNLRTSALKKVEAGITDLIEINRVTKD